MNTERLLFFGVVFFCGVNNIANSALLIQDANEDNTIYSYKQDDDDKNISKTASSISTLTNTINKFKPWEAKLGVGFDIGTNGLSIGAMVNLYRNFTPDVAGFAGVDYRYNALQFKHKASANIEATTRTKMDLLFKLGARFKVNKDISLSPYAILGMGIGEVKQEKSTFTGGELDRYFKITSQSTLKSETKITNTTYKYDGDGVKQAVKELDFQKHKEGYDSKLEVAKFLEIDMAGSKQIRVKEVFSPQELLDIAKTQSLYKESISVDNRNRSVEMEANLLPVLTFKSNSYKQENDTFLTFKSDMNNGVAVQNNAGFWEKGVTQPYEMENYLSQYSLYFNGNGNAKWHTFVLQEDDRLGYGEQEVEGFVKTLSDELFFDLNNSYIANALNVPRAQIADMDSIEDVKNISGLENINGYNDVDGITETYTVTPPTEAITYDKDLTLVKIKDKLTGEDIGYLFYTNGKSLNEVEKEIKKYNDLILTDEREKLQDDKTETTTENKNEVKENYKIERHYNEKQNVTKTDTIIDKKNKVFFKGGLGFEMTFKDRFFVRFEYKYSQLGATNTSTYFMNHTTQNESYLYNTDYTKTITTNVNNIYKNNYSNDEFVDSPLTSYNNSVHIQGTSEENGLAGNIKITNGGLDTNKSTTETTTTYNYQDTELVNSINDITDDGLVPHTEINKTTFHMHEFSFGFGFYFL